MPEIEKLMVTYKDSEIEVIDNRSGLKDLGESYLTQSSDEKAKTAQITITLLNNAEDGSIPMLIPLNLKL
jgi:hypothetical protein